MEISNTSPTCPTPDDLMLATEFASTTGQVEASNVIDLKGTQGPPSTPYEGAKKNRYQPLPSLSQLVGPQSHQWD
ncbi:hypothetical protein SK128_000926, partial [Halocaridina rubra]